MQQLEEHHEAHDPNLLQELREDLIYDLAAYGKARNLKVTLVFDAMGNQAARQDKRYACHKRSAVVYLPVYATGVTTRGSHAALLTNHRSMACIQNSAAGSVGTSEIWRHAHVSVGKTFAAKEALSRHVPALSIVEQSLRIIIDAQGVHI